MGGYDVQHIRVAACEVYAAVGVPDEERDKEAERPAVALTERVQHIQLVVEVGEFGDELVIGHTEQIVLSLQPLEFQPAYFCELRMLAEDRALFGDVDSAQSSRPVV